MLAVAASLSLHSCAGHGESRAAGLSAADLDPALERVQITITGAYMVPAEGTSALGGAVEPDRFVIKVQAREVANPNDPVDKWPRRDFFVAAVRVGTEDVPDRYGGRDVRFVRRAPAVVKQIPGSPLGDMATFVAETDVLDIRCAGGKISFEQAGEASDDLVVRVHTSTQVARVEVWQGGSPNPGAGDDFDPAAKLALPYEC